MPLPHRARAQGPLPRAELARHAFPVAARHPALLRCSRRRDLQTAAALEPNRSLLRSYLGKAYSYTWDNARAAKELKLARDLDENDPTPWLYTALVNQEQNRILLVSILLRCQKTESKKYILINVIVIVFIVWVSVLPRREVCHDSHLRVFRVWFGREPESLRG